MKNLCISLMFSDRDPSLTLRMTLLMTSAYFIRISVLAATLVLVLLFFISGAVASPVSSPASSPSLAATLRARRAFIAAEKARERRAKIFMRIRALTPPDVTAEAYIVRLLDDDTALAGRRTGKILAPASIT